MLGLVLRMHFGALPAFVVSQQTSNPYISFWTVLGITMIMVVVAVALMAVFERKQAQVVALMLEREVQRHNLANAAREAHELTIAYACHQMRFVHS